jgi:copper homeostasis protein CutC
VVRSAGLLARINFANALTTGLISGVKADATALASQGVRRVLTDLTGSEPAAETVAAIEQGASGEKPNPNIIAGAIIASPDFQKR